MRYNYFKWLLLIFLFISLPAFAKTIGDIAGALFGGGMEISSIIQTICIITGVALIFASLLQYKKHRNNPTEVPISTVLLTLLAGLALLALAFVPIQIPSSK
jgi:Ca2+/H+ antiporter